MMEERMETLPLLLPLDERVYKLSSFIIFFLSFFHKIVSVFHALFVSHRKVLVVFCNKVLFFKKKKEYQNILLSWDE